MQAVFDAVPAVPGGSVTTDVGAPGFLVKGIGVAAVPAFFRTPVVASVVLLIFVLPFIDAGSQDHLSGTRL
jgi:hypothetical protein